MGSSQFNRGFQQSSTFCRVARRSSASAAASRSRSCLFSLARDSVPSRTCSDSEPLSTRVRRASSHTAASLASATLASVASARASAASARDVAAASCTALRSTTRTSSTCSMPSPDQGHIELKWADVGERARVTDRFPFQLLDALPLVGCALLRLPQALLEILRLAHQPAAVRRHRLQLAPQQPLLLCCVARVRSST
jgi:hypothetical protein